MTQALCRSVQQLVSKGAGAMQDLIGLSRELVMADVIVAVCTYT